MIVVTGGAGFIGSNLAAALNARGEGEIIICERLRDGPKWRNIARREIAGFVPPQDLFALMNEHRTRIQAVFHLGACSPTTETNAARIADDIEAGMLSINHHGIALPETPFGGIKDSGFGHEGGIEGLQAYMTAKMVSHLG